MQNLNRMKMKINCQVSDKLQSVTHKKKNLYLCTVYTCTTYARVHVKKKNNFI